MDRGQNTPDRNIKPTENEFKVPYTNSQPEAVNTPSVPSTFGDSTEKKPE